MTILIDGFDSIRTDDNPSGKLVWYCAPDSWKEDLVADRREGRDGTWCVVDGQLVLHPPAKKDFWRKTYYDPLLVKDDGPILYYPLSLDKSYTIETAFTLHAVRQFDQAGIFLRMDAEHWIKTGIEVVDNKPRLSCVVCNIYSDWSTQPWAQYEHSDSVTRVEARIRVHCRNGGNYVVEAATNNKEWEFIRIAHMSQNMECHNDPLAKHPNVTGAWQGPSAPQGQLWAGVFACCPEDQQGGSATFIHLQIKEGSSFEHNANGNQD